MLSTQQTNPPKVKLALCVCSESNWFLLINTLPRFHGVGQMPLAEDDHIALTHECYMDCSKLFSFPVAERAASRDRGVISEEIADKLIEFVETENIITLTLDQKVKIVNNLSRLY